MNIGEMREKAYAEKVGAKQTAKNTHAIDGIFQDGTTYEFKTLIGSKPSIGGKRTLENEKSIGKAIEKYMIADFLVVEITENHYLKMDKQTAIKWLTERVTIAKASEKRGAWYKLRLLKNPRNRKTTEYIKSLGFET